MQTQMQLRLLFCATLLATADARLALSVDSHTTLVVTPERVYESAASLAIIDAADSAVGPEGPNTSKALYAEYKAYIDAGVTAA